MLLQNNIDIVMQALGYKLYSDGGIEFPRPEGCPSGGGNTSRL